MNFLLDTHIFIWWILDDPRLKDSIRAVIDDPNNHLYLSAASTWEIVIKSQLGKIVLPESPERFIIKQLRENAVDAIPITVPHTIYLLELPLIHKDPFDRLLIAQASYENLTIITDDPLIKQYSVKIQQ